MARILFTAADINELNCAIEAVSCYKTNNATEFDTLLTGIGTTSTCYRLTKAILEARAENKPYTLIINIGIAGSFNLDKFSIGSLAIINKEYFGDLGFESNEKGFQTLFEYGMYNSDMPPFTNGALERSKLDSGIEEFFSKQCCSGTGVTVQRVIADSAKVEEIREKFSADIESMEGAAIYYVCLLEDIPALEVRAVSNKVGVRDKKDWNIPLALKNLNLFCNKIVGYITNTTNL